MPSVIKGSSLIYPLLIKYFMTYKIRILGWAKSIFLQLGDLRLRHDRLLH